MSVVCPNCDTASDGKEGTCHECGMMIPGVPLQLWELGSAGGMIMAEACERVSAEYEKLRKVLDVIADDLRITAAYKEQGTDVIVHEVNRMKTVIGYLLIVRDEVIDAKRLATAKLETLRPYARHKTNCLYLTREKQCNCGLIEALI